MSGYILCQGKRARIPYYIENISTNIYTMEELCYYLNHNIYLLDETILNEGLCRWILEELGLRKLYDKLYRMLDEKVSAGTFILPIFKEISYLSMEEFRELNGRLQQLEGQPPLVRQKIKGDYLMENGKYVNAIRVYQKTLGERGSGKLGQQFAAMIWYNMGCAYSRLFQLEEAADCFCQSLKLQDSEKCRRAYLIAACCGKDQDSWAAAAARIQASPQEAEEARRELERAQEQELKAPGALRLAKALESSGEELWGQVQAALEELTAEYHKNTGY